VLAAAGEHARGATAYVTLEPCAHHGRTPPCADALIAAGVARVVVAVRDPNPVAGGGLDRLADAGVAVSLGVEEPDARELNAPFFHRFASDRAFVTLKLALSLDGALARADRAPGWITGPAARREVHRQRAQHDAIAVGIGTVLADDPQLTVRGVRAPRVPPVRVVFDRTARLPLGSRLVRGVRRAPVLVVAEDPDPASAAALTARGVEVLRVTGLPDALRRLAARGLHAVYAEGGATLAAALLGHGAVDRLVIFQGPVVFGAGALPALGAAPPSTWAPVSSARFDADSMTIYHPA
jgi:diaminohydroxyphosphoribosylaminopyrimidine deaminase/5-amino-6-(5-phosphoribosylamino)uracil reductase